MYIDPFRKPVLEFAPRREVGPLGFRLINTRVSTVE